MSTYGHGDDEVSGVRADGLGGCTHGSAGGEAVIDEKHVAALNSQGSEACAVGVFTSHDLCGFFVDHGVKLLVGDAEFSDEGWVEGDDSAGGDSADGEFRLAGRAKLANCENVEWEMAGPRNFIGDGNATAGQTKNDCIL
jgi:hypothetical protein